MGQPAADSMPPYCSSPLRPRPPAASAARCGGGALCSAPARSALSAFAVQLRPRFGHAPASGIFHHCTIQAARDTQRFARRPATGPAVMHRARCACSTLGVVLVWGPYTTANQRLRSTKASVAAATPRGRRSAQNFRMRSKTKCRILSTKFSALAEIERPPM